MESAENREQSQQAHSQLAASNSSSVSLTKTFNLLNDNINYLESSIKRISKNSDADLPFSTSINTLKHIFSLVAIGVTAIALRAPAKLIAIAIAIVFWLWLPQRQVSFFSMSEATAAEIIVNHEITSTPEIPEMETSVINSEISTDNNTIIEDQSEEKEVVDSELETAAENSIPQDLVSPGKSQKLDIETIKPKLTFTPEQTLISVLQTKIVKLTQDYGDKFVDSIKVDFPNSSLSVEVKDSWYELRDSLQNKLANDILKRSRKLHFDKLEFKDSQGTLVARNPVVGEQIIILQSHRSNEQSTIDD